MSGPGGPKVKAFNINPLAKKLAVKDKFRKEEEDKAAAEAYEEFLASFEEPAKHGKLFVRGSVINAGSGEEKATAQTGKLYKPPKLSEATKRMEESQSRQQQQQQQQHDFHTSSSQSAAAREKAKKKEKEKKKSNLELFKEELKIIQEEREERYKMKGALKDHLKKGDSDLQIRLADDYRYPSLGSFDTGDPNTTNLYLGNLNPKMTEQELCEIFGRYGPLASVKIMWPRSQEERQRKRNCGFVAYMNRKDGERAIKHLSGQEVMGFEMKMGWGKAVPIPPHPVYIPPAMVELTLPPPPSGLPFNAQPQRKPSRPIDPQTMPPDELDEILANAVVKVVIPTERSLLCLIHRMIEFVVREGPMFEAMIMNRELNNPMFRFLFENQSPAHVYYRWRLFSILQGDHPNRWRTQEFRMFEGGSLWKPPPMNPYLQGMPPELVEKEQEALPAKEENKKGSLSDSQRDKLEDMLRNLTPERPRIMEAMVYCIEHADAAEEIVDCITQSLSILETPLHRKVARLYLISDVLHNCSVKVANASFFRKGFQVCLPDIFKAIHEAFSSIEGRLKAEQFKQRVMSCFRAWEDWAIYPNDFLIRLQNIFLGLVPSSKPGSLVPSGEDQSTEGEASPPPLAKDDIIDDVDGVPLATDVDLDGLPLVGLPLVGIPVADPDLDGVPLGVVEDPEIDGQPLEPAVLRRPPPAKFVPSKWETVDPETVSQQAVTTSKWDLLDQGEEEEEEEEESVSSSVRRAGTTASPAVHPTTSCASSAAASVDDDIDGEPLEDNSPKDDSQDSMPALELLKTESGEERRAKLREIEVKVMKFQDELESGKRQRKPGLSISAQVEHYRQKLIRKDQEKSSGGSSERRKERSKRSRSQSRSRSRSRSPISSPLVVRSGVSQRSSGKLNSPVSSEGKSRRSRSRSPRSSRSHRSRSPKKRRSRSRSPHKSRRSRSRSPHRRRSSQSPPRKSHKSKKSKH